MSTRKSPPTFSPSLCAEARWSPPTNRSQTSGHVKTHLKVLLCSFRKKKIIKKLQPVSTYCSLSVSFKCLLFFNCTLRGLQNPCQLARQKKKQKKIYTYICFIYALCNYVILHSITSYMQLDLHNRFIYLSLYTIIFLTN